MLLKMEVHTRLQLYDYYIIPHTAEVCL